MLTGTPLSSQYGEVLNLVLSSKKAGTAVVEFATVRAAVSAMWGFRGLRQPFCSRGGTQFCGPCELRYPHSQGISGPAQSPGFAERGPPALGSGGTANKGMGGRMFQGWLHFLLPGSVCPPSGSQCPSMLGPRTAFSPSSTPQSDGS